MGTRLSHWSIAESVDCRKVKGLEIFLKKFRAMYPFVTLYEKASYSEIVFGENFLEADLTFLTGNNNTFLATNSIENRKLTEYLQDGGFFDQTL